MEAVLLLRPAEVVSEIPESSSRRMRVEKFYRPRLHPRRFRMVRHPVWLRNDTWALCRRPHGQPKLPDLPERDVAFASVVWTFRCVWSRCSTW